MEKTELGTMFVDCESDNKEKPNPEESQSHPEKK